MEKGSSSSSSPATGAAESLNGLQFGKKIYFEDVGSGLDSKTGGGPLSSPAKKGRVGVAHGGQPPRCQVEGCLLDLSDAKAYYSRHKVCGMHSKSSTVIVAGIEQRFCQQCSRFHKLTEFDQGKRSCRRRLACHNERRRKPPSGSSSVFSSPYGSLSPNMFDRKTGGFLMDLTAYSTPAGQGPWPNAARGLGNHQLQLPWQTNIHDHPLPSYSNHGVSSVECCFFNGVSDSSSALSLLSNQESWASRSRPSNIGLNGFHGTNANANGTTTEFQPSVNHPVGQSPDLGLGQISVNGQYNINGEQLGLGQPNEGRFHHLDHSRGYDSFV